MDAPSSAEIFLLEGFRLDRRGGVLYRRDEHGVFAPMAVGGRALDILGVLVERPGDLVSRAEIADAVWPGRAVEDSNLNVQVAALRHILDDGQTGGSSCIQTVPGRGYRFVGPVARAEPAGAPPTAPPGRGGGSVAEDSQPDGPGADAAARTAVAPRMSIVVLPFANLSDDREQQHFADGITDDLTTDLSRIAGMFVISCNTALTYRNRPVDTKQIGRELGVRYVLEGSLRRSGNQVRVNVQLINAETNAHLWADRFDRDMGDLFALQNEITSRIAIALNRALIGAEAARPTTDPDALDYIFRARVVRSKLPTHDSIAEEIGLLERALALEPGSTEAQIRLAFALMDRVIMEMSSTRAADIARAEGLLGQVSPDTSLAHRTKGQVLRAQRRYAEAIPEYEAAIALDRNAASTYANLGQSKLLTGSLEEVIPLVKQAIRLSPRDSALGYYYDVIGLTHLLQSRTDEAIVWFEKARTASPGRPIIRAHLAAAYGIKGESERAAAELAEARRLNGDGRYSSIARLRAAGAFGIPKIRALFEAIYFAGLRLAGMPEE